MRITKYALGLALPVLLWQAGIAQPQRLSYSDTKKTIERIKDESDRFKDNFNDDVHRAGVDSRTRHEMRSAVSRFEEAAEDLKHRFHKDDAAVPSMRRVLADASYIDSFMSTHVVSPRVQDQWLLLRQDLDLLASSYNLDTGWPSALARTEPAEVVIVPVQPGTVQFQNIVRDIQTNAAAFQTNVRGALASSSVNVDTGSEINQYIGDFMVSADRLQTAASVDAANDVLQKAEYIDRYMKDHQLSATAQESWIRVRNDLFRLAAAYSLTPAWLSR